MYTVTISRKDGTVIRTMAVCKSPLHAEMLAQIAILEGNLSLVHGVPEYPDSDNETLVVSVPGFCDCCGHIITDEDCAQTAQRLADSARRLLSVSIS